MNRIQQNEFKLANDVSIIVELLEDRGFMYYTFKSKDLPKLRGLSGENYPYVLLWETALDPQKRVAKIYTHDTLKNALVKIPFKKIVSGSREDVDVTFNKSLWNDFSNQYNRREPLSIRASLLKLQNAA